MHGRMQPSRRLMQERLPGQIRPTMEPLRNAVTRSGMAA
ncbi:hypothetical protein C4K04_4536 [Pseudomonas chlororaphis]|uniref:Uncharacterized protein n=1 Tax=Pseudomonas chlororaphis TaxID=587753 RepID=A0A3G7TSW5_9PSED|nr:hypothetical protein C4K04_4536 [Pseudomonas chlororaphis]